MSFGYLHLLSQKTLFEVFGDQSYGVWFLKSQVSPFNLLLRCRFVLTIRYRAAASDLVTTNPRAKSIELETTTTLPLGPQLLSAHYIRRYDISLQNMFRQRARQTFQISEGTFCRRLVCTRVRRHESPNPSHLHCCHAARKKHCQNR